MLGQDVRIEQWDRKQLRDAEIRRWGGGSGWARWRWDGRNWFRENKKGELRAAGADWGWRPARRHGVRYVNPSKLRYVAKRRK
jgi:hypothetical protein